jgi:hypothetical protein
MKPRLFRANGESWCCGLGFMGRGETHFQAWMNWLKLSLSQYDFEAQP